MSVTLDHVTRAIDGIPARNDVASVATAVSCPPVVPRETTAAGSPGSAPCAISPEASSSSPPSPMNTTSVPPVRAGGERGCRGGADGRSSG